MSKKNKFYLIVLLLTFILLSIVYFLTRPKEAPVINNQTVNYELSYNSVNQFIYNRGEKVCIFVYNKDDIDSTTVINNYLEPIKEENRITTYPSLYYVDLSKISDDEIDNYIKVNFNINHYPTFMVMSISNSKVIIEDVLEWDNENPYSINDVRDWLKKHSMI